MPLLSGCQALGGPPASRGVANRTAPGRIPLRKQDPRFQGGGLRPPAKICAVSPPWLIKWPLGGGGVLSSPPVTDPTALLCHLHRPACRVHCGKSGHSGSGQGPGCCSLPLPPSLHFPGSRFCLRLPGHGSRLSPRRPKPCPQVTSHSQQSKELRTAEQPGHQKSCLHAATAGQH